MLTRLRIKNFKKFDDVDIELGNTVVFVGPNNSGKTAALQALVLWEIGLRRWNEKREGKPASDQRPGVSINRKDLIAIPTPDANLLWNDLHVRSLARVNGKPQTKNIRIDITVDGVAGDKAWSCGLEFDYANEESFYCRPLRLSEDKSPKRMTIPKEASDVRVAFLPPMSGLAAVEPKWEPGRVNVLLGEGQTAQVLRNLCYLISERNQAEWAQLCDHIRRLFGVRLLPPSYIAERGEITMAYEEGGIRLDISSSGRGLQQTLLLLSHLYANPGTVLLLDEPDAHLEWLRQRETYALLTDVGRRQGCQIIAASHAEVVLNEAADRDVVIAFVGRPHRIDDRGSQVLKALKEIGFDQYAQAEQTGWVLYLEGSTDLATLRQFARTLDHPAAEILDRCFVRYVGNQPSQARQHFFGLKEAHPQLVGIAIFDRIDKALQNEGGLCELAWRRRELENYICQQEVLVAYARSGLRESDLIERAEASRRETVMREAIGKISSALEALKKPGPWSADIKASDEFLDPVFETYFEKLGLENLMRKNGYHVLATFVPRDRIDPEITEKLDAIVETARRARPRTD